MKYINVIINILLVGHGQPSCTNNPCTCCKNNNCDTNNGSYCVDGCIDGVLGDTCDNYCPADCNTCTLDTEGRLSCTSCISGKYSGRYWDNSDEPYFDDCRHYCRDGCVSCARYYNCSECFLGHHGLICEHNCYSGCEGGQCDKWDGKCTCKSGDTNHFCKYTI